MHKYMGWCVSISYESTPEMVFFNTDGIAGGNAGTWRGAYEYQVPASGDGASLGLWNICLPS